VEALSARQSAKKPRVQVDFNEYDRVSREIPIPHASMEAIERTGIAIRDGLVLQLYSRTSTTMEIQPISSSRDVYASISGRASGWLASTRQPSATWGTPGRGNH
jgi:hypothetical protein